ncbi:MAG: hypothetical protein RLZZ78_729 [Armatimonadota bacterium]
MPTYRPSASIFRRSLRAKNAAEPTPTVLAQRFAVAYRGGDKQLAEKLHTELFNLHFYKVQLFCERRILRMQTTLAIFEAEDIAIEAWAAVVQLMQKSQLEIKSDNHFIRLLFKTAKHRFLDRLRRNVHRIATVALERPSSDGSYIVEQDTQLAHATSDRPAWLSDNPTLNLLQCLFASEISFINACAGRPRRRAKVYQTAIMYLLITETMVIETDIPSHIPYMLAACGLQQRHWDAFLAAMGLCEYPDPDTILAAVNIVFGTNINSRRSIAVLKYEFTQMISLPSRRHADGASSSAMLTPAPPRGRRIRNAVRSSSADVASTSPQQETLGRAARRESHLMARARHPQPNLQGSA